jgi:hypothetical protein
MSQGSTHAVAETNKAPPRHRMPSSLHTAPRIVHNHESEYVFFWQAESEAVGKVHMAFSH